MGFKCAPQILGLTRQDYPKGKHRANGKAICLEAGSERISASVTLDRGWSPYNKSTGYDSGLDTWLFIEQEADGYMSIYTDKNGVERHRKLKEDAVVGFAVIINPPAEICSEWNDETYQKFYNDTYEILCEIEPRLFRKENVISTYEHYDEGVGVNDRHEHSIGICKDENGKFCGNLIDAKLLSTINKLYPKLMRDRGWDMDDLETTDWDRFKTDEAYREERKKAHKSSGKTTNEYISKKLKKEVEKAVSASESYYDKIADVSKKELELVREKKYLSKREKANADKETELQIKDSQITEREKAVKLQEEENERTLLQERLRMKKSLEKYKEKWIAEYKNKLEADFQVLQDELEAQNKAILDEKLREQVSDVQDYKQYKRSKSSNIVSVIADTTLNFNQFT